MADTNAQGTQGAQGAGTPNDLKVIVPDAVRGGTYSNAVSVNVNSNEVVVDFGYLLPNTTTPEIEVVARVNMNQRTAESFLSVLAGAMEDFKKKQASANQAAPMPAPAPVAPAPMPAPTPAPAPAPMVAPETAVMPPMPPLPENA